MIYLFSWYTLKIWWEKVTAKQFCPINHQVHICWMLQDAGFPKRLFWVGKIICNDIVSLHVLNFYTHNPADSVKITIVLSVLRFVHHVWQMTVVLTPNIGEGKGRETKGRGRWRNWTLTAFQLESKHQNSSLQPVQGFINPPKMSMLRIILLSIKLEYISQDMWGQSIVLRYG